MKRLIGYLLVPTFLIILAGCTSLPTTNNPPADNPPATDEQSDGTLAFGETRTWSDGVSITVSVPEPFEPSQFAIFDEDAAAHLKFTITLVNGSDEPFDPILVFPKVQSGSAEAEQVFDTENGLDFSPSGDVLPGRELRWQVGFSVADPTDLVFEIAPGFLYDTAYFTT